jgi:hypothetical protein
MSIYMSGFSALEGHFLYGGNDIPKLSTLLVLDQVLISHLLSE